MNSHSNSGVVSAGPQIFTGGGELGRLMREFRWSDTSLGPVQGWPQSLKTVVRIVLDSHYPMFVWWGRELINLYNDECISVLGNRHPAALGRPAAEVWREIWHIVGPPAEAMLNGGAAMWSEKRLLIMERNGYPEETYFTLSHSPIPDDAGDIGGVFCVCTEDTQQVLAERRLKTLRTLAARTTDEARSVEQACQTSITILASNRHDIPFALVYLLDADADSARLSGVVGLSNASPAAPPCVDLTAGGEGTAVWPLRGVLESRRAEVVQEFAPGLDVLPGGVWPDSPRAAVVLPITQPGYDRPAGFLIVGVSPRRTLDDDYRGFFELLASHIATAIANARAYEEERRRAESSMAVERALRESEARFRTVADSSPAMIWMTDVDGRLEFMNLACQAFLGVRPEDAAGFLWQTALHVEDAPRYVSTFMAARAARSPFHARARMCRGDGQWRWIETRATPRFDAFDVAQGYVGCSLDITDIYESQQALQDADRRKDEFLATLAHELRNPLAPLRNGLQIVKLARGNDAAFEQAHGMMERQLHMLVSLVEDLLDVSRISCGQIAIHKQRIDIASVVTSALETSEPLVRLGDHQLSVTLPPQRIYIYADKIRLAQAIGNLLSNAAKYTKSGGHISLTVTLEDDNVYVRIKDSGVGIPPHMLSRVFDMFTQVDTSIERAQGGLGIGLTVVKRLVEMHGGTVQAHSAGRDQGSEFAVRLPVAPAMQNELCSMTESAATPLVQHRILVVDDNREAALSLALMLNLMGNDTRTAFDGLEALDLAQAYQPDVMLMDIGMPKLNGYDAARRIREQAWGKRTVLVAVTGWGQDADRRSSRDSGFDHHLVKPVEPEALETLLASLDPCGQDNSIRTIAP